MRYKRRNMLAIVILLSLSMILTLNSIATGEIRYDPGTDIVSMSSQDFRDLIAVKTTAQEQVVVLRDELVVSRSETAEALALSRLSQDLNKRQAKRIKQLAFEVTTWKIIAEVAVASHAFR